MKLNKKIKYLFFVIITLGITLSSCSEKGPSDEEKVLISDNITLQVKLNIATRAEENEDVTGGDAESLLKSVNLYFAKVDENNPLPDNDEIIYSIVNIGGKDLSLQSGDGYNNTYLIKKQVNTDAFATIMHDKKIRLYVVANMDCGYIEDLDQPVTFDGLKKSGSEDLFVPMSNQRATNLLDFSGMSVQDIRKFISQISDNILDLNDLKNTMAGLSGGFGDINLERSWARIDYKDKERRTDEIPHLYTLKDTKINLKIISVSPFNVSDNYYLFRHTAKDVENGDNIYEITLFGEEGGSPYRRIADSDWGNKTFLDTEKELFLLKEYRSDSYSPMMYVSENTSTDDESGNCTGMNFHVLICNPQGEPITPDSADIPAGISFDDMGKMTVTQSDGRVMVLEKTSATMDQTAGYYLTYPYVVEHNLVPDGETNIPMHTAIVRNNVYQLSVQSFSQLPTPEEPANTSITVNVKVNAWRYYIISDEI